MAQDENIAPRKRQAVVYEGMDSSFLDDDDSVAFNDTNNDSDFVEEEIVPVKKKTAAKTVKAPKTAAPKKAAAKGKKAAEPLQAVDPNEVDDASFTAASDFASPVVPAVVPANGKSASANYQRLTQLEHVLKRPDTYIGSVEHTESQQWIYNEATQSMELRNVSIVPGLYKIFDEILVNAADNKIRDPSMDTLNVEIDPETNTISVYNNGKGIPIEIHEKEKMYIPELIFGNLLTSSNYDDDKKKVTGGRNGYGAKVSSIYTSFQPLFAN